MRAEGATGLPFCMRFMVTNRSGVDTWREFVTTRWQYGYHQITIKISKPSSFCAQDTAVSTRSRGGTHRALEVLGINETIVWLSSSETATQESTAYCMPL